MSIYGSSHLNLSGYHGASGPTGPSGATGAPGATGATGATGSDGTTGYGINVISSTNNSLIFSIVDSIGTSISQFELLGVRGDTGSSESSSELDYTIKNLIEPSIDTAILFKGKEGFTAEFYSITITGSNSSVLTEVSQNETILIGGNTLSSNTAVYGSLFHTTISLGGGLSGFPANNIIFDGGTGPVIFYSRLHQNRILKNSLNVQNNKNPTEFSDNYYKFSEYFTLSNYPAESYNKGFTFAFGGAMGESKKYISVSTGIGKINDDSILLINNQLYFGLSGPVGVADGVYKWYPSVDNAPTAFPDGYNFRQSYGIQIAPDIFSTNHLLAPGNTLAINDTTLFGSCCYCNGFDAQNNIIKTCSDYLTEDMCLTLGGSFSLGVSCSQRYSNDNSCISEIYTGVCCANKKCTPSTKEECESTYNGFYVIDYTCSQIQEEFGGCPDLCEIVGSCCIDGNCLALTSGECQLIGNSIWKPESCADVNCCLEANFVGACCLDEYCYDNVTPHFCSTLSSDDGSPAIFWGVGSRCNLEENRPDGDCHYEYDGELLLPGCYNTNLGRGLVILPDGSNIGCCRQPELTQYQTALLRSITTLQSTSVVGDLNNDGYVDEADLSLMLENWGINFEDGDLNKDGIVDDRDVSLLFSSWKPPQKEIKGRVFSVKNKVTKDTFNKTSPLKLKKYPNIGSGLQTDCSANPINIQTISLGDKLDGGYFIGYIGSPGPYDYYPGKIMFGSTPSCIESGNCPSTFAYEINSGYNKKTKCECDHTLPINSRIIGIDKKPTTRKIIHPLSVFGGNIGDKNNIDKYMQYSIYGTDYTINSDGTVTLKQSSDCIRIHRRWALIVSEFDARTENENDLMEWGMLQSSSYVKNGKNTQQFTIGTCAYDGYLNTRMFDDTSIYRGTWFESNYFDKNINISYNDLVRNPNGIYDVFNHPVNSPSNGWTYDVDLNNWKDSDGQYNIHKWRNDYKTLWTQNNPPETAIREISRINKTGEINKNYTGYYDWYIPSSIELNAIKEAVNKNINKKIINSGGESLNGKYWTSTSINSSNLNYVMGEVRVGKNNAHNMLYQDFDDGSMKIGYRRINNLFKLRPVRRIPIYTIEINKYYKSTIGNCSTCNSVDCSC